MTEYSCNVGEAVHGKRRFRPKGRLKCYVKGVRPFDRKALLKWLRGQLRDTLSARNRAAKLREYGEAQLADGIAQAYEFTILYVERGQ
jgi:hypothetical protein